nr:neprilysin-3-like isoform X2 [Onthophagus taurus]
MMREIEYVPRESSTQENRSKWTFASLLVVIFVLIVTIGILLIYVICSQPYPYCTSTKCIERAFAIKSSMDQNYDPCDNFYKFVCNNFEYANYGNQNPMEEFSNFRKTTYRLNDMIQKMIQMPIKKKDSHPIRMIKKFYAACSDKDEREKLGLSVMDKYLTQANLPRIPTIFTLPEQNWDNYTFNWVKTSVMMKKIFGIDLFFKTVVSNDSVTFLIVPDESKIPILISKNGIKTYENLYNSLFLSDKFKSAMIHLISEMFSSEMNVKYFRKIIEKIWLQFVNITEEAQFVVEKYKKYGPYLDRNDKTVVFSFKDFQKITDKKLKKNGLTPSKPGDDWKSYVMMLHKELSEKSTNFSNINVRLFENELDYIVNIPSTLRKTSGVMLEMFAWWKAIDFMILHTTDEMATTLNNLLYSFSDCLKLTINKFNLAISHGLITEDFISTKPQIMKFIENLLDSFQERIEDIKWINDEIKELIYKKLASIDLFVGVPDWILDEKRVMKEYEGIKIKNYTHLDNLMQIVQMEVLKNYNDPSSEDFYRNLIEVKPYYNSLTNSITIPWSILSTPFYNLGLPSLEYGALGTLIAYEIIDEFFNILWSQEALQTTFKEKMKCFIEQYGNFSESMQINENIADNEGTNIAFTAMAKYFKTTNVENKLPGLEIFSSEQLFFISQAHVWCFVKEPFLDIDGNDEIITNEFNVNGIVQNAAKFSESFNCPLGSKMNPERKRCEIW